MILPTAKAQPATNPKSMLVNLDGGQLLNSLVSPNTFSSNFPTARSFVRWIDFKCSSGLAQDIISSLTGINPLIRMYHYPYGSSILYKNLAVPTEYSPGASITGSYGYLSLDSTGVNPTYLLRLDFKASGIGGFNAANTNDGVYIFQIDQFKNGTYSYQAKVYRLYGDAVPSLMVDTTDYNAVINASVYGKFLTCAENCDGAGQVYTVDVNAALTNRGRSVATQWNNIQI